MSQMQSVLSSSASVAGQTSGSAGSVDYSDPSTYSGSSSSAGFSAVPPPSSQMPLVQAPQMDPAMFDRMRQLYGQSTGQVNTMQNYQDVGNQQAYTNYWLNS